jgi:hypothetical protein
VGKLLSLAGKGKPRGAADAQAPVPPTRNKWEVQMEQMAALIEDLEFRVGEQEKNEAKWQKRWARLMDTLFGSQTKETK